MCCSGTRAWWPGTAPGPDNARQAACACDACTFDACCAFTAVWVAGGLLSWHLASRVGIWSPGPASGLPGRHLVSRAGI
jgi:hypothetical protein